MREINQIMSGGAESATGVGGDQPAAARALCSSSSVPMGARAAELYEAFAAGGAGGKDFAAIINAFRAR